MLFDFLTFLKNLLLPFVDFGQDLLTLLTLLLLKLLLLLLHLFDTCFNSTLTSGQDLTRPFLCMYEPRDAALFLFNVKLADLLNRLRHTRREGL